MRHLNFLYLLGPLSCSKWANNEIRYSLRSINRVFAPAWVGITGPEIPPFLSGITHIASDPKKEKMRNIPIQLLAACTDPRVPENLILMNDDFIVRDHPIWDWVPTHAGPIDAAKAGHNWRQSVLDTGAWLRSKGVAAPLSYEGHTPMPFKKSLAAPILREIIAEDKPMQFRSAYGNIVGIGGVRHPNAKRRSQEKWPEESPFWSLKSKVTPSAQKFLAEWLNTPSPWEI